MRLDLPPSPPRQRALAPAGSHPSLAPLLTLLRPAPHGTFCPSLSTAVSSASKTLSQTLLQVPASLHSCLKCPFQKVLPAPLQTEPLTTIPIPSPHFIFSRSLSEILLTSHSYVLHLSQGEL